MLFPGRRGYHEVEEAEKVCLVGRGGKMWEEEEKKGKEGGQFEDES